MESQSSAPSQTPNKSPPRQSKAGKSSYAIPAPAPPRNPTTPPYAPTPPAASPAPPAAHTQSRIETNAPRFPASPSPAHRTPRGQFATATDRAASPDPVT